jgi:hypothetical protein
MISIAHQQLPSRQESTTCLAGSTTDTLSCGTNSKKTALSLIHILVLVNPQEPLKWRFSKTSYPSNEKKFSSRSEPWFCILDIEESAKEAYTWSKMSGSPKAKPHDGQGFVFLGETLCFWKVKLSRSRCSCAVDLFTSYHVKALVWQSGIKHHG